MSKEIIINHTTHETRVAVMEGGILSELHHEREQNVRVVDNIYKGKVLNVLPGMESAFVDIGSERAAFLHIDDILPDNKMLGDSINQNGEKPQISNIIKESLKTESIHEKVKENSLSIPLKEARENFEKEYLTTQLKKFGGNISKMAKFVGMERSALHRKLKTLGVKGLN